MKAPGWLFMAPAFCLGVLILTAILVIFALRRGSQTIRKKLQEPEVESALRPEETISANTRWARGDLKAAPEPPQAEIPLSACPACGGENPAGSRVCAFCGRNL